MTESHHESTSVIQFLSRKLLSRWGTFVMFACLALAGGIVQRSLRNYEWQLSPQEPFANAGVIKQPVKLRFEVFVEKQKNVARNGAFNMAAKLKMFESGEAPTPELKNALEDIKNSFHQRGVDAVLYLAGAKSEPKDPQVLTEDGDAKWSISIQETGRHEGFVKARLPDELVKIMEPLSDSVSFNRIAESAFILNVSEQSMGMEKVLGLLGIVGGGVGGLITIFRFIWEWFDWRAKQAETRKLENKPLIIADRSGKEVATKRGSEGQDKKGKPRLP